MEKNIQRIGMGGRLIGDIGVDGVDPVPGYFTFDSTAVTFDSDVDTFDFDVIPVVPIVVKQYSENDYSNGYS